MLDELPVLKWISGIQRNFLDNDRYSDVAPRRSISTLLFDAGPQAIYQS